MNILKYSFSNFFTDVIVQDENYVTNGHFIINKSILTKAEINTLNKKKFKPHEMEKYIKILNGYEKTIPDAMGKDEMFTPNEININPSTQNVIYDTSLELALREEYYNMFAKKECKLYKTVDGQHPVLVFKDNKLVGLVLPVRYTQKPDNCIDYKLHQNNLQQQEEENQKLKELNKKCLYINNNKAIVRNKPLTPVTSIINNSKYSNLYIDATPDTYGSVELYINLDIVFMSMNKTIKITDINVNDASYYLDGYDHIDLTFYENYINESLESDRWVNTAEIKLMELIGKPKEYIDKILKHRGNIQIERQLKREIEDKERKRKEKEYVEKRNNEAYQIIGKAEKDLLEGNKVFNEEITIYRSKYDSHSTSLILYLMKKYNIKVHLRTQGWINNALDNIQYDNVEDNYNYQYYTSSSDSTVFMKSFKELVKAIKEKHENVA